MLSSDEYRDWVTSRLVPINDNEPPVARCPLLRWYICYVLASWVIGGAVLYAIGAAI